MTLFDRKLLNRFSWLLRMEVYISNVESEGSRTFR